MRPYLAFRFKRGPRGVPRLQVATVRVTYAPDEPGDTSLSVAKTERVWVTIPTVEHDAPDVEDLEPEGGA